MENWTKQVHIIRIDGQRRSQIEEIVNSALVQFNDEEGEPSDPVYVLRPDQNGNTFSGFVSIAYYEDMTPEEPPVEE